MLFLELHKGGGIGGLRPLWGKLFERFKMK